MLSSIFSSYALLLLCFSHHLFCSATARDTLTSRDNPIKDDGSEGLVSAGGIFELGFFTPSSTESGRSGNGRYVGIWYHQLTPRTVVWVSNRDTPVPANSTGVIEIKESTLHVWDPSTGVSYWSAEKVTSSSALNPMVKLMDSGNLVLSDGDDRLAVNNILWQSFQNPTDTFIPGMKMDNHMELTSWKDQDDPRIGDFTFKLDQEGDQFVTLKNSTPYWRSEESGLNSTSRDPAPSSCWTWSSDLNNLQEEYGFDGHNLSARVALSGIESTGRDCKPCGTTIIPYPLSTGPECGDPMYFRFNCSTITGPVSFVGPNGTLFRVISINPSTQRFVIQAKNVDNCDPINGVNRQQLNLPFPFNVISCYVPPGNFSSQLSSGGTNAVEIGWKPPPEPTCTTSADCRGWPHSTCSPERDGKKRCLCNANYQWSGFNLNCTQGENAMLG
ncbi:hypothetical protein GBA52_011378 [Prunus armeniaca]|nr:hypothetical protein GBA52_011378 [Prunus armeniaca]